MNMEQRRAAFAKRFVAALERSGKSGLSDEKLSAQLALRGVSVGGQAIANWRHGRNLPKLEQFEGLADLLEMDVGELAFGRPRVGEARGVWARDEDRQLVDGFALLEDAEREVLLSLLRLLASRRGRPGPKKRRVKD